MTNKYAGDIRRRRKNMNLHTIAYSTSLMELTREHSPARKELIKELRVRMPGV